MAHETFAEQSTVAKGYSGQAEHPYNLRCICCLDWLHRWVLGGVQNRPITIAGGAWGIHRSVFIMYICCSVRFFLSLLHLSRHSGPGF